MFCILMAAIYTVKSHFYFYSNCVARATKTFINKTIWVLNKYFDKILDEFDGFFTSMTKVLHNNCFKNDFCLFSFDHYRSR